MKVTLHKGGTGERKVKVNKIVIPDLWHIASLQHSEAHRQAILTVWHLAHDLKRELIERS